MRPREAVEELGAHLRVVAYTRPLVYKASRTIMLTLYALEDALAISLFPPDNDVDSTAGLRVCTSSWRRANSNAIPVRAKVNGASVNGCLSGDDAVAAGFDEPITLTYDSMVPEGSLRQPVSHTPWQMRHPRALRGYPGGFHTPRAD